MTLSYMIDDILFRIEFALRRDPRFPVLLILPGDCRFIHLDTVTLYKKGIHIIYNDLDKTDYLIAKLMGQRYKDIYTLNVFDGPIFEFAKHRATEGLFGLHLYSHKGF